MNRILTDIDPNMAILAGKLGPALRMHAAQRAEYFFMYLFWHRMLTDRMRDVHGVSTSAAEGVMSKATHQIATGLRSKDGAYYAFDTFDASMLDEDATRAGKRDAAHYCNLGVDGKFMTKVSQAASGDAITLGFLDRLTIMAGATRELPQRINIGPDRVVDKVHGELAPKFLSSGVPVSLGNYLTYLDLCEQRMGVYQAGQSKSKHDGIAACCECYIDFYTGATKCERPRDPKSQWSIIMNFVEAEVSAYKLKSSDYLQRKVASGAVNALM